MVKNGASSQKTNHIDICSGILNPVLLYWCKSYDNFAKCVDFAYWWGCIGKGLRLQHAQQACFNSTICNPTTTAFQNTLTDDLNLSSSRSSLHANLVQWNSLHPKKAVLPTFSGQSQHILGKNYKIIFQHGCSQKYSLFGKVFCSTPNAMGVSKQFSFSLSICDMWHVTHDMWHARCDMWHVVGGEHSLKISDPKLFWFVIYDILKIKRKRLTDSVNEWRGWL